MRAAILIAFSLASAPPLVKKKTSMSPGARLGQLRPSFARASVAMNGLRTAAPPPAPAIARVTRSSPWPIFTHINWELKSR